MGAHTLLEPMHRPSVDAPTEVLRLPVPRPALPPRPPMAPMAPQRFGPEVPPAGLDEHLFMPMPWAPAVPPAAAARSTWRRRAPMVAAGVGVAALLASGFATVANDVTAAASSAPTASAASGAPLSAAAKQCGDTVAEELDTTMGQLRSTSPSAWSSVVNVHQNRLWSAYGQSSPEYTAYSNGANEILTWLYDSNDRRSYSTVAQQVVPEVVSTCSTRS